MTYMNAYFPWLPFLGHVLEISEKQDQAGQPRLTVQSWAKEALLIRNSAAAVTVAVEAGFYLGYLRGRSFPQKNIVISTVNHIGKIIQTRRGQCTHRNISQNCLKMHQIASQRTFISKNLQGAILTLGTSPPDDKSQIEPWEAVLILSPNYLPEERARKHQNLPL